EQEAIKHALQKAGFKDEVKNHSYKYEAITQGWDLDPVNCTAGLIETGVHFRATDENGETREIVVKLDPTDFNYKGVKVVHDKDRPTHGGIVSPTANFAGYAMRGASAEASSQVYQSALTYPVPTPNDPVGFDCGTTNLTACWVSVWTGLTTDSTDAQPMVQTGTDSICRGINCATAREYVEWFEIVNSVGTSTRLTCTIDLPIDANDSMLAQVTNGVKDGRANSIYDIALVDITDNQQCTLLNQSANFGDPKNGLYVAERPKVDNTLVKLASFTDITNTDGKIYYGGLNRGVKEPFSNGWFTNYEMWQDTDGNGTPDVKNADTIAHTTDNKITFDYISSTGTS
ncbi:MAG: hypothetical protein ACK4TO_09490, partial [Candidatus Nitrosotenuis sp.]